MFGFFESPKCPRCGSEIEETGYSAPYPSHRCNNCISRNKSKKNAESQERRILELERKLENLSGNQ